MDLGQPIARGRTAEVYAGQEGQVLKLFYDWFALEDVEYEARIAGAIHANGLHVPSVGKVIRVNGRKIRRAQGLPAPRRSKALTALENMPDGGRLCHGDFHPGNILMTLRGEIIIDWIDASHGNPLADVARSSIIALGAAECQVEGRLQKAYVRIFHAAYLHHYFRRRPGGQEEYRRWLPIMAAARLSEEIPELEAWLNARAEAA